MPVTGLQKTLFSSLAVVCAAGLWIISLRSGIDLGRMNDLGLISVLPLTFYLALGVLTVSFCLAIHRPSTPIPLLLLHVVVLIAIIHATPTILYGTLRYSWAWKHVGIVDYILRHGSVDPSISFLNAYHNWPGFFALNAFITNVAGFKSALSYAAWGPPFFNLLDLGGLLLIFNSFTRDYRQVCLGAWFFYVTNWVGQDYFSPQATTYFLNLVILGVCLTWFRVIETPSLSVFKRWLVFDRAAHLFHRLVFDDAAHVFNRLAISTEQSEALNSAPRPARRGGLLLIIILMFAVIASTHQLTPFMTILEVLGLVVFQRCRVRNLPLLLAVITVTWIVNMAVAFLNGNLYWIVQSIGHLDANANSTLINVNKVSWGLHMVALVGRVLTASAMGLAVLGFIRRLRHGYWDLPCVLLALAPIPMLAANSYGGEMLFRVYFFALPFLAFFAASLIYPSEGAGRTWRTPAMAIVISGGLLVGFCFAYYGKERMNYFSKQEVAASQYLFSTAPTGALLIDVDGDYPWAFKNYERFNYRSLVFDQESGTQITRRQRASLLSNPVAFVSGIIGATPHSAAYVIFTRSQAAMSEENGYLPSGSLGVFEQDLKQSGHFTIAFTNSDATVFILRGPNKGGGQRTVQSGGH